MDFTPVQDNLVARTYAEALAFPPLLKNTSSPRSTGCPFASPYAATAKRAAKIDEDSNEVHLFSQDREEVWDGYYSVLDKSDKEENLDSDFMPPDKEAKLAAAAAKVAAKKQVCQSFQHLDIEDH